MSDALAFPPKFPTGLTRQQPFSGKSRALLCLWWLEHPDVASPRFAYGWIVPRDAGAGEPRGWQIDTRLSDGEQWRLVRASFEGRGTDIRRLAALSARGATLGQMYEEAGADPPREFLHLGVPPALVPAPWTMQPTRARAITQPAFLAQTPSPMEDVLAYCASMVAPSKGDLIVGIEQSAEDVLEALKSDTGLDFLGAHASRIGNLEAFVFPAARADEAPGVSLSFKKGPVRLEIDTDLLAEDALVAVRCRQRARQRILCDELRDQLSVAQLKNPLAFDMAESGPWSTDVDVWVRHPSDGVARLWFSQVYHPIRSIGISMGISSGSSRLRSGWLEAWSKAATTSARAAAFERVTRVSHETRAQGGTADPLWLAAEDSAAKLTRAGSPPPTNERFFAGGFSAVGGQLSFAEWFVKELGELTEPSNVLIVDPEFDEFGVELLARMQSTQVAYSVLAAGSSASERIQRTADALAPIMHGLQLEIGCVVSPELALPFHERIALVLDRSGQPLRGYHFSGSIQALSQAKPVLVTPISSSAVLDDVAAYVRRLQQCDSTLVGVGARFELLWPSAGARPVEKAPLRKPTSEEVAQALAAVQSAPSDDEFLSRWKTLSEALANTHDGEDMVAALPDAQRAFIGRLERILTNSEAAAKPISRHALAIAQLSQAPLTELFDRTYDALEYWERDYSGDWPTYFAARLLAAHRTDQFVRASDLLIEIVRQQRMPHVSDTALVLHTVVAVAVEFLQMPSGNAELPQALVRATAPFLRALGAAALGSRALAQGPQELGKAVEAIVALSDEEHGLAIASWVGELRVRANRRGSEGSIDREARILLFEALRRRWPTSAVWKDVAGRLDGPTLGTWCVSTTEDLLLPLVGDGRLSEEDLFDFWATELYRGWQQTLDDRSQFHTSAHAPLTQLVAYLATRSADADHVRRFVVRAAELARHADALRTRPFARSVSHTKWWSAISLHIWLKSWARLFVVNAPQAVYAVSSLLELADPPQDPDLDRFSDPTGLRDFAEQVAKVGGRIAAARP